MVHMVLAGTLVLGVVAFVLLRPRGLAVAWPAGVGAVLALLLGLLSPAALITIFQDTWDAAATLIALFILSETLDSNGFFTWAALHLALYARGSGWRLYGAMLLLTTGVTALLANDGAVLMLTPIFATLLLRIYSKADLRLPFILAAGFFADAMSGLFVPSNLTNIILAGANHLSFMRVAEWMALPTLCAFIAGGAAFAIRFRRHLCVPYDTQEIGDPGATIHDWPVFWAGIGMLAFLVVGYTLGGEWHLPVALVAGPAALVMLVLTHLRRLRPCSETLRAAPWGILIYALGMFVVITAAFDAHLLTFLTQPLRANVTTTAGAHGALVAGSLVALLAAAVNNLPSTLIGVLALRSASHISMLAIYAIMLGVDIGPKLTPFGSLATLLWMEILARNGISISWRHYLRENWWVTLLAFAAAFLGLLATQALLG